ncbi:MAG: ArsR family transcriptional regulator [Natronomonas sp.]
MTEIDIVPRRREILKKLYEEPRHKRDLVAELDSSRSTVDRAVRELENAGLVERQHDGYTATLIGRLALDCYSIYRNESEAIFDAEAALEPLPNGCDLPLELIGNATVRVATDPAPYRPMEQIHQTIRESDSFRMILPVLYDTRFLHCCYEHAVEEGNDTELVVDETVVQTVREDFPEQLKEKIDCEWFTLRAGETTPYGLLLSTAEGETTVIVVVFDRSFGPVHAILQTADPGAVQWAEERFERATAESADIVESVSASGHLDGKETTT